MHGDGVTSRWVSCAVAANAELGFVDVLACFRRFWCPTCRHGCLVGHPGIVPRIRAALTTVAAAVRAVVDPPLGQGLGEVDVQQQIAGAASPSISERARSGRPRWHALRRWVRALERWWPTLTFVGLGFRARTLAFVAAIGPGLPIDAFLEAAVQAHLRGGAAM
jgi:hypothetical protein